jgi:argininosuccinate lyase
MPGFTHLQTAQPITFGHHLMAYVEMFGRDRSRFADCRARLNESPLGAAALAGSPHPIDPRKTAKALGFDRPMANSLDAVSDRDYVIEFISAASTTAVHLSRLSEEIVIWCSAPFRFIALSDAFTTGSSIMPQKRNPDAAELTRAKVGRIVGAFVALCTILKGLPLTYGKDMQEDKEPLFDAADSLELGIAAMTGMIRDLKANPERMRAVASADYSVATDLADWLVRKVGLPFRQAHHVTGRLVGIAADKGIDLDKLSLEEMQAVEPKIDRSVYRVLTVEASVNARKSLGGTAPSNVERAVAEARRRFLGKAGGR